MMFYIYSWKRSSGSSDEEDYVFADDGSNDSHVLIEEILETLKDWNKALRKMFVTCDNEQESKMVSINSSVFSLSMYCLSTCLFTCPSTSPAPHPTPLPLPQLLSPSHSTFTSHFSHFLSYLSPHQLTPLSSCSEPCYGS